MNDLWGNMGVIGKSYTGTVVRWQDEKGFGFIRCAQLEAEVFFHIRAYCVPQKRPQVGDNVVFVLAEQQGKWQAQQVQEWLFVRQQQRRQQERQQQQQAFKAGQMWYLWVVILLYVALLGAMVLRKLPWLVWCWYLVLGGLTFWFWWYGKDKRAARNQQQRTPENTLHLLSLLGGWLGAGLAQTFLRHKSQKASFRARYFLTVLGNILLLGYLIHKQFFIGFFH